MEKNTQQTEKELHDMLMKKYPHIPNEEGDEATERVNLIRVGRRSGYTDAIREIQSIDIPKLASHHTEKMEKYVEENGEVPDWWLGVITLPVTALNELTKK